MLLAYTPATDNEDNLISETGYSIAEGEQTVCSNMIATTQSREL